MLFRSRMVEQKKLRQVQISSSLDCWGPQQEYTRWGLDLNEWVENFEYLLDKPWIQQCINSAINPLSIHTTADLVRRINQWNDRKVGGFVSYSFMTVMYPQWMDPANFGAGVFDSAFDEILLEMRDFHPHEKSIKHHMEGIAKQISAAPRNVPMINALKQYLDEIDRRRNTQWRDLFPWLDQDWK